MEFIKTKDGSYTVFNSEYKEHYHSISGAYEEALEKHVKALNIQSGMKIIDFCFGLGYNSIVATKNRNNLEIIGLEIDPNILLAIKNLKVPTCLQNEYDNFRTIAKNKFIRDNNGNSIKIILADAKESINTLPESYFDRIFFDPFSPRKQPELWTTDIFARLYELLKIGGKISTYSCAKNVRENMKNVGFTVIDGPIVGRRSPATIAIKEN